MDSSTPDVPGPVFHILPKDLLSLRPDPFAIIYSIAAIVLLVYTVPYVVDPYGLRRYPGPVSAKFTEFWLSWAVGHNRWSQTVHEMHQKYGTFVRLSPNHVSIADPSALAAVYGHTSGALKAPFYDTFTNFRARNMFNARSREEHARKRRLESHTFAPHSVLALESTTRLHFKALTLQWDKLCEYGENAKGGSSEGMLGYSAWRARDSRVWFNCMPWFSFWSFDTIGDLAFGSPFGMLPAAKDTARVASSTKAALDAIARSSDGEQSDIQTEEIPVIETLSSRADALACLAFLPKRWQRLVGRLPQFRRGVDAAPKLAGLSIAAVARRLAQPEAKEDMLRRLLEARDDDGKPMGPEELSAESFLLIIAGADTVANTSCAITYYVSRDQRVQAKLQAELDEALATVDDAVAPYDTVKDLPYLDAVINEGLRVHSTIGAGLPRIVPAGGLTVLGERFKEGTWVSVPTYTTQRNKAVWGKNADEFYPERWIGADGEAKKEMMRAFAPFSLGPRACIGRNLALMQLHIMIATLFRRYSTVLESNAPLPVQDTLVRKSKNCIIGVKRRDI